MSEVLYNFLKKNLNKRVLIITKGEFSKSFRYEGIVKSIDKKTVEINDRKVGDMVISLNDILNARRARRDWQ